jgi:hypothetical protein
VGPEFPKIKTRASSTFPNGAGSIRDAPLVKEAPRRLVRAASAVVLLRDEPIDVELGLADYGDASGSRSATTRREADARIAFAGLGLRGPLGVELRELDLPQGLAEGIPCVAALAPSDVHVEPLESGNVVQFSVGGARFVYDRWGLRRLR